MLKRYIQPKINLIKKTKKVFFRSLLFCIVGLGGAYFFFLPAVFKERVYHQFLYKKFFNPLVRIITDPINHNLKLTAPKYEITLNPEDWKRLITPESNFTRMNPIQRPKSGQNWIDGYFRDLSTISTENSLINTKQVKLKLRGSSYFHYVGPKKSLWIKTRGDATINGWKQASLINIKREKYFIDHFVYDTAKKIDLLSPFHRNVHLYLNKKYQGLFHEIESFDNNFLLKKNYPLSDIYFLDIPEDRSGFYNPQYWRKKARAVNISKKNVKNLTLFLEELKKNKSVAPSSLDVDKNLKHIILFELVGSRHVDYIHNHRIYFNPLTLKFEPIAWDVGDNFIDSSFDKPHSPFYTALMLDPYTRNRKYILQKQILEEIITPTYITNYFEKTILDFKNDIRLDKYLGHYYSITADEWIENTKELIDLVVSRREKMLEKSHDINLLDIRRVGLNRLELKLDSEIMLKIKSIKINNHEKLLSDFDFYSKYSPNLKFRNEHSSNLSFQNPIVKTAALKLLSHQGEIKNVAIEYVQLANQKTITIRKSF